VAVLIGRSSRVDAEIGKIVETSDEINVIPAHLFQRKSKSEYALHHIVG
jgi:hypothetical protein